MEKQAKYEAGPRDPLGAAQGDQCHPRVLKERLDRLEKTLDVLQEALGEAYLANFYHSAHEHHQILSSKVRLKLDVLKEIRARSRDGYNAEMHCYYQDLLFGLLEDLKDGIGAGLAGDTETG